MSPGSAQTALLVLLPFFLLPAVMGLAGGLYLVVRTKLKTMIEP